MSLLTDQMNQVLDDWRSRFDFSSAVSMQVTEDIDHHVCFNGLSLFKAEDRTLISAQYDALSIRFVFNTGPDIVIYLDWPEELPAQVSALCFDYSA